MTTVEEVLARKEERCTALVQSKMKPSERAKLQAKAEELGVTMSNLVRVIVQVWLEEED